MGGERHLEATMVGQEMQVSIEDGIGGGDLEAKVVGQECKYRLKMWLNWLFLKVLKKIANRWRH